MEGIDQEDRDLDEIAAKIVTIGARNLESLRENKDTDSPSIFDSPQKQSDQEPKKCAQNFFGPLNQQDDNASEENVVLVPTTKTSAVDITQLIIEEISKPVYKTVVEAEFVFEEDILSSKSSKTDAGGDIQDRQEATDRDQVNISIIAETSKESEDKETVKQNHSFTSPKPLPQKLHWKKRLHKFLMLGVANKLEVGYPPGYPIPKLTKSYFRKRRAQAKRRVEPQADIPACRSSRENLDAQVNNKKGFVSKFARSNKGDIIKLNNITNPNTSDYIVTNANEMRCK